MAREAPTAGQGDSRGNWTIRSHAPARPIPRACGHSLVPARGPGARSNDRTEPLMTDTRPTRPYPLGPLMFGLAFVHLLLLAGVLHRAHHPEATLVEVRGMEYGLLALWPVIVLETRLALLTRNGAVRRLRATVVRAAWTTLPPPLRMGMPCP